MKFKADEIASVLQKEIEQYQAQIDVREVGRVLEVGDGIARVYGLSSVMSGEMVEFPNGTIGLAFNLDENSVGVIILGDYLAIHEGDEVRSTGRLLSVPSGKKSSAACSTRWAIRSTARAPLSRRIAVRSNRLHLASPNANRFANRCKRASRPSTR